MSRIAALQLTTAHAGYRPPAPPASSTPPIAARSAKVLSLLLIVEALRQAQVPLDPQKG